MQTTESYLRLQRGGSLSGLMNEGMTTCLGAGPAPSPHVDGADDVADRVAKKIAGVPHSAFTETLFNTPTTAHILGGCCMGEDVGDGVIDRHHRVFGYDGLYVVDGSAVSANPGVNPSMTITAMAERAMAHVATAAAEDADRTRSAPPKQPRP